ncbi:MAG: MMPL family transporter [Nocardioides sp.]
MSTRLYRLGLFLGRHAGRTVVGWVLVACALVAGAVAFGGALEDDFSIPGSESQAGIEALDARFPGASGVTAEVVVAAADGRQVTDPAERKAIRSLLDDVREVGHVVNVEDPFADPEAGTVSADRRYALSQVQLDVSPADLESGIVDSLEEVISDHDSVHGIAVSLGGQIYNERGAGISLVDLIGVAVAFVVLLVTFGSALAAGIPLAMSFLGAAISLSGILLVAATTKVNTSTPSLALMIVLAVGIDYGLFILSRHRQELANGQTVPEAIARSVATAGSAIVFAGATVVIALCGLALAGIPFLSLMGAAAGAAVVCAVAASLTLLPSILVLLGERMRPKNRTERWSKPLTWWHRIGRGVLRGGRGTSAVVPEPNPEAGRWGRLVARRPWSILAVVAVLLTVAAIPALGLRLALPDNGSAEVGTPARETFDLVATGFGPGYNAPLAVTADIVSSDSPQRTIEDLADRLRSLDGVAAITRATPNPDVDLALVRVIPKYAQSDPRTLDLVETIRGNADRIEDDLGVTDLTVTGISAVSIDVSARLVGALVPFSLVVVGLAFLLSMMVFRSVAIPIKATVGFVFSVGVAFSSVALVYEHGWLNDLLNVPATGPVISFLPIMVMAILFGLSMDYEVCLVSRIREEYIRTGDAHLAIDRGYRHSQRVVNAAGIIMIAVFVAFIPHGNTTIKPMAIALGVGVFVDAFVIRATLARAVLVLLDTKAWWFPRWLDHMVPHVDAEGQAIVRQVALREHERVTGPLAVRLAGAGTISTRAGQTVWDALPDLEIPRGGTHLVEIPDNELRVRLAAVISGQLTQLAGTVEVLSRVLPDEASGVRSRVVACLPDSFIDQYPDAPLSEVVRDHLRLRGHRAGRGARREVVEAINATLTTLRSPGHHQVAATTRSRSLDPLQRRVADLVLAAASKPSLIIVVDADQPPERTTWARTVGPAGNPGGGPQHEEAGVRRMLHALAATLATEEITVVIISNPYPAAAPPWSATATAPAPSPAAVPVRVARLEK